MAVDKPLNFLTVRELYRFLGRINCYVGMISNKELMEEMKRMEDPINASVEYDIP